MTRRRFSPWPAAPALRGWDIQDRVAAPHDRADAGRAVALPGRRPAEPRAVPRHEEVLRPHTAKTNLPREDVLCFNPLMNTGCSLAGSRCPGGRPSHPRIGRTQSLLPSRWTQPPLVTGLHPGHRLPPAATGERRPHLRPAPAPRHAAIRHPQTEVTINQGTDMFPVARRSRRVGGLRRAAGAPVTATARPAPGSPGGRRPCGCRDDRKGTE